MSAQRSSDGASSTSTGGVATSGKATNSATPSCAAPGSKTIPIPEVKAAEPDLPVQDCRGRSLEYRSLPPGLETPTHLVTGMMLYDGVAGEIFAKWPHFPLPFSTPSPPVHKIVPVKGSGLGMIATTNIARGETILRERPLLLYPVFIPGQTIAHAVEHLEKVVQVLPPENRDAVYALTNVKGPEPSHLKGIFDTNSLGIHEGLPGYRALYSALPRDISRINHSCIPNAYVDWDLETLSFIVRATWPIAAGEQVTISYIELQAPRSHRQEELSRMYNFTCMCKACGVGAGDQPKIVQSDLRRVVLNGRALETAADEAAFEKWVASGAPVADGVVALNPGNPSLILRQVAAMNGFFRAQLTYNLMEEEGWFHPNLWESVLVRLVKGYSLLQDENSVRRYAIIAALFKKAYTGSDGGWWDVARNPTRTEWWGKLGQKHLLARLTRVL